ncbi:FAD-dependent monooxygenase [Corallococcus carmarthensis]|uniref:FAD-binding monooxygenase n=1 Tax=Corallococcus carmarthensis TaxID=2316728 RepID=A0A3A8K0R3_9BACT|nr:FAD-dependent monooxygenase [Corallococcus carmarthensis]NOK19265.1 FAD-binding monooxygenase [Corallococcus carmarthensis]RKH00729.1 FAD-binding monooxygenase [Corallococcus carmarthensis]
MKMVCVGGGPAGLYFSILAKLSNPKHDVTVVERNPAGVTYGWGVVFWDDLLDDLYRNDPVSAQRIAQAAARWDTQEVHLRGQFATHIGGYGFALGRDRLLDILIRRAKGLGVDVRFQQDVTDASAFADADLVVACDGVNSRLRQRYVSHFQTHVEEGRNKYIWLGTNKVFDAFTFAFEETPAGWLWFHGYRFNGETSTCIVECQEATWKALGFDTLGPDETLRKLEDIFQNQLRGRSLFNQLKGMGKAPWLNFKRITNERWYHDNVVLMGDAAHTTHFSIGSGTKLAIQDAIGLAQQLRAHPEDLPAALEAYDEERRAALLAIQLAARSSSEWFENVPSYVNQDATAFAYSLLNRRGSSVWSYLLLMASQQPTLRGALRQIHASKRWVRARRRGRGAVALSAPPPG